MNLQEIANLLRSEGELLEASAADPVIGDLAVDSREVQPGALFMAIPGVVADGHDYVDSAIARGAAAVMAERAVGSTIPLLRVRDARRAAELVAIAWFHNPAGSLNITGVTGTNGKTTTTALLQHLLGMLGRAGSIGTLGAIDADGAPVPSTAGQLTTPGPVDLQRTFRGLVDRGVHWVAMEASSHALEQGRLDAVQMTAAVFTNLTRDHLDFHPDMDAYLKAKLRLAARVLADGTLAVNADEVAWKPLHADPRTVLWGQAESAHLKVSEIHQLPGASSFRLSGRFGDAEVMLPLPGEFNIANAVGAATVLLASGQPIDAVAARLSQSPQVPGRMERLADAPFHVIRDYAHTPDALARLLTAVRAITPGKVLLVFGCGGDRDRGKRAIMGEIAARGADLIFVTSDNPRREDPQQIIDDVVDRMPAGSYQSEVDRTVAIGMALGCAARGDTVVLAGKGHEIYQVIGDRREPFDERQIVRGLMGL